MCRAPGALRRRVGSIRGLDLIDNTKVPCVDFRPLSITHSLAVVFGHDGELVRLVPMASSMMERAEKAICLGEQFVYALPRQTRYFLQGVLESCDGGSVIACRRIGFRSE